MGSDYKHNRLSGDFINLTNGTVNLYESCTGEIWKFSPRTESLPESPHFDPGKPLSHYIVDSEMAEKLRESGRSLEDIAIIDGETIGRKGLKITKLVWGENPDKIVRLYREFKKDSYTSRKPRQKLPKRH